MGILDRLRSWAEPHADVDIERTSAEVVGRMEQATDRLARAVEELARQVEDHEGGSDSERRE